MAYIKITNGTQEAYSIGKLRRDNKNISFPKVIPDSILSDYGVYSVVTAERPDFNVDTQNGSINSQATLIDGQWTYEWTVTDKSAEELQAVSDRNAASARAKRDALLAETDWWALSDNTMTQAQTDYRQALRDITAQDGFPNDITWPEKP